MMLTDLHKNDVRDNAFQTCVRFINYELVEGDICEFGVYTGRSLALLAHHDIMYKTNENTVNSTNTPTRTVYGFDSWDGLPFDQDHHPRWNKGLFKMNHSYHPTITLQKHVTPEDVCDFFKTVSLPKPILIKGFYENIQMPSSIDKIALAHIDCDLYESTLQVLEFIKNKLTIGSLILFDDWFHYKADPTKGEQKAFNEFLQQNPTIKVEQFLRYATFCNAFVIVNI